ncbi:conjugative transposon protein TraM [Flavobacterium macacae]|uniref:Conjugative transposon protein TraM n=1 Tax=Flavobacterium macacae TaxID=2488993 RepID=A0A3P3W8E5_9FLAO|nr:conjugative transposon protein TraM [Flavobacterium macacae]RRJ90718.1 conjugative transposon protein TraM [Flavobacterium macacae]
MENSISIGTNRKRRLYVALPWLVLPFLTVIFWAFGGGRSTVDKNATNHPGFNLNLPDALPADVDGLDKMSYYEKAALDSTKREDLIRKDPNYISDPAGAGRSTDTLPDSKSSASGVMVTEPVRNSNEEKVYSKLKALQSAIRNEPTRLKRRSDQAPIRGTSLGMEESGEMERLEQMMLAMNAPGPQDPELQQLNGMLENILDIQHPERAQEKLRKASQAERGQVFAISTSYAQDPISGFQGDTLSEIIPQHPRGNAFYSLQDEKVTAVPQNSVEATVYETQTIVNGSTVKMSLANDIFINGVRIPKNNFIYGTAALKGERLTVKVSSLRYESSIFPVDLSVFDLDGVDGIYIPGAINRDVAKASADRSVQTLGVATLDDSWGSQAAGAGIEAAKSLFSRKVKLVKVVVKAGYRLLLRDQKQKQ